MSKINYKQSKEKIKKLVERYEKLSDVEKKRYNERQTEDHFIRPLFEALGWDFEKDVWPETDVSGKRVDYAFKIGGVTKFFIEAKAIPVNLDEERWAEQAINYSWHKSVPWVILTDFEAVKIFNTEWDEPNIQSCQFIEIPYTEYLTNEKLWWLSKEFFQKGILEKEADKISRRPKKIIDDQLANDLIRWRELLFDELKGYNLKIDKQKIAEYVQKILDRLIFIRTLEDRKIEDIILQPLVRNWKEKKGIKVNQLLIDLNKVFRKIDKTYNSGLFEKGACDFLGEKIEADDNTFIEIINELYKTKDKGIRYNFADIPADIFGNIYEQYLGHIQKENGKEKKTSKRKSQGIYYTPRYIVDYIVQNTLGEILKEKSPEEIRNLKILDPACGSGSFLISAYQTLIDYWQRIEGKQIKQEGDKLKKLEQSFKKRDGSLISSQEKMRILLNNIYGVDLDKEAVELAKLNLLLKMVNSKIKLPQLANNIQEGNSLISGTEKELKKYFGKNWKDKKPFEWKEKYDVVIGNPPYIMVENLPFDERKYLMLEYETAIKRFDIYIAFIEKGLELLKPGGFLGFIIPYPFLNQNYAEKLRQKILQDFNLIHILDLSDVKVFGGALVRNCVVIIEKPLNKEDKKSKIIVKKVYNERQLQNLNNLSVNILSKNVFETLPKTMYRIEIDKQKMDLLNKVENKSINLGQICYVNWGARTGDIKKYVVKEKENNYCKKMINARNINRYAINYTNDYLVYKKDKLYNPMFEELFESPKIIVRDISGKSRLKLTFDNEKYYTEHTVSLAVPFHYLKDVKRHGLKLLKEQINTSYKYDLKYVLALANSNLMSWYFISKLGGGLHVYPDDVKKIPIYKIDFSNKKEKAKHDKLVKLADKMLKLNKDLQKLDSMLDEKEYKEIKEKIEKTDKEIDERVFKLYGLGKEEIKIIKNFNKKL